MVDCLVARRNDQPFNHLAITYSNVRYKVTVLLRKLCRLRL